MGLLEFESLPSNYSIRSRHVFVHTSMCFSRFGVTGLKCGPSSEFATCVVTRTL